jgi:predicted GH43/DUF377 family glycosyl hydrolase
MTGRPLPRRTFLHGSAAVVGGLAVAGTARGRAEAHSPTPEGGPGAPPSVDPWVPSYPDGRPVATLRMDATDAGPVLLHGDGPGRSDVFGARDVWVFTDGRRYYMHYDGAGDAAWLTTLATSGDGLAWSKYGTVLDLGPPGSPDSASASYGTTYHDGRVWQMFYIGTQNVSPPHNIPAVPYVTLKAKSYSPTGPWTKEPAVIPFTPQPGTYYSATASAGQIIEHCGEYLQFFSASAFDGGALRRTIGIARTTDLEGGWQVDPAPVVPLEEQVENSSLYYERADRTWYLFTNHVGLDAAGEYTDAIWVYWSDDPTRWDPDQKGVVLDRNNCAWSGRVIGLPSVLRIGHKLAIYYDGVAGDSTSHLDRDIGLAWLDLPLRRPLRRGGPRNLARGARTSASSTYPGYAPANIVDGSPSTALGAAHSWCNDLVPLPPETSWLWYPEGPAGGADMPDGAVRYFRKTADLASGAVEHASIVTTADDQFTLFVNGSEVARSPQITNPWQTAVGVDVTALLRAGANSLAAVATNGTGPAGFLCALEIRTADGAVRNVVTDGSWRSSDTHEVGWEQPGFDDSSWPVALAQVAYGSGPWGSAVTMPSTLPQWVQLEFRHAETFDRIELYTTSGFELTDYRLQAWRGSAWVDIVAPVVGNATVHRTHTFHPISTSRIRVVGERTASQPGFVRVNEIQVYRSTSHHR